MRRITYAVVVATALAALGLVLIYLFSSQQERSDQYIEVGTQTKALPALRQAAESPNELLRNTARQAVSRIE